MELKVVLLGASGAGKTTLAKILSEKLSIEYVSNSAGGIMPRAYKDLLSFNYGWEGGKGQLAVIEKSHEIPAFGMTFQNGVLDGRKKILQTTGSVILDRSPLDPLAFFYNQLSHSFEDYIAWDFRDKCCRVLHDNCTHMIKVDLINPERKIPLEEGAGRLANWFFQKKMDKLFNVATHDYWDWCQENGVKPIPYIKINFWDLDNRVNESLGFLNTIK